MKIQKQVKSALYYSGFCDLDYKHVNSEGDVGEAMISQKVEDSR